MTYKKLGRPPKAKLSHITHTTPDVAADSTEGSDMADTSPEATAQPVESAQANDQSIKQLLKAIYNDGAYGTKRSLQEDLETITRLLT